MCLHLLSGLWRCISVIVMQSCNWLCIKAWRRIIGILLIRGNKEGNAVAVRMHFVWKSPQLHCKWFGCLDYSLFNPSWVFIPWRMSLTKVNVHYNAREGDPRRSCFLRNLLYYYIYLHLIHYCIFAAVSFPTAALTKTLLPLSYIWILFLLDKLSKWRTSSAGFHIEDSYLTCGSRIIVGKLILWMSL